MGGFRALPSVDQVLLSPTGQALIDSHGRTAVTTALRARLDAARTAIKGGADGTEEAAHPPRTPVQKEMSSSSSPKASRGHKREHSQGTLDGAFKKKAK